MTVEAAKWGVFDRERLGRAWDRPARQIMSRYGAYARTSAQSSLRPARRMTAAEMDAEQEEAFRTRVEIAKRKGQKRPKRPFAVSAPGEPPRMHHKGKPVKRLILFHYDKETRSVIAGPKGTSTSHGRTTRALERSGRSRIVTLVRAKKRGNKRSPTPGPKPKRRAITARVQARPFMAPAATKNLSLLKLWKNSIK